MAKSEEYPIIIGTTNKNKSEVIVVAIGAYKGQKFIDIRVHFRDKEDETKFFPTKKGIALSERTFQPIVGLLFEAYKKLQVINEEDAKKKATVEKPTEDAETEVPEP